MRRVPLIRQVEATECGLAAVSMIAQYHGHRIELADLRRRFAHTHGQPRLASILAVADRLQLDARPVRVGLDELARLSLPAILHWEHRHFVVLSAIGKNTLEICDPASGRRRLKMATVSTAFTGVAIEFSKAADFKSMTGGSPLTLGRVLASFKGLKSYLAVILTLLCSGQLLALAVPVATQLLVDEIVLGKNRVWLGKAVTGIAFVMFAMIIVETLRRRFSLFTGIQVSIDTASAAVRHLLSLPVAVLERRPPADTLSRIDSLQPVQKVLTESAVNATVQFIALLMTLALMLFYSPRLTGISIVSLALVVLLQGLLLPTMRARNLDAVVASAEAKQSLFESLRNFAAVHAMGIAPHRHSHWHAAFTRASNARAEQGRLTIVAYVLQSVVGAFDQLAFLFVGILSVADKTTTLGVLFAFVSLRGRLGLALANLLETGKEMFLLRSHLERIAALLIEKPEPPAPRAACRSAIVGGVGCRQLSYQYPGGVRVFDKLDCDIAAGEKVVICGPSGVGKTTLLRLLATELRPDCGEVRFDGLSAGLWDLAQLRTHLGVVRQTDTLFSGSISDNLCGFSVEPEMARIREAARLARIWDDILALPMQLETPLLDAGTRLSGGQVQRLLLARALYRQPRILLLDEATNQLDERMQNKVLGNLAQLDITIISVAHDQNTIRQSGRPLLIRPSRETQHGNYAAAIS